MTEKEKQFITTFDEVINNREKIKTPDEVGKSLDSLQEVVNELLTESNPVDIDHELLVKYNKFLAEDLAKVSMEIDSFGRRKNSLKQSSLPTELEGREFEDICSRIKSMAGYFNLNHDINECRFFECYRVYLNPAVWNTYNSLSEWYTKEFLNKDSVTSHIRKLLSIINGFYKILIRSGISFSNEERSSWKNIALIQCRAIHFVKTAAAEILFSVMEEEGGGSLYPDLIKKGDTSDISNISDLFDVTVDGMYYLK